MSRLVNQLVLKFKGRIAQPLSCMLAHLTAATFAHIAQLDVQIVAEKAAADGAARAGGPQSQFERERYGPATPVPWPQALGIALGIADP